MSKSVMCRVRTVALDSRPSRNEPNPYRNSWLTYFFLSIISSVGLLLSFSPKSLAVVLVSPTRQTIINRSPFFVPSHVSKETWFDRRRYLKMGIVWPPFFFRTTSLYMAKMSNFPIFWTWIPPTNSGPFSLSQKRSVRVLLLTFFPLHRLQDYLRPSGHSQ